MFGDFIDKPRVYFEAACIVGVNSESKTLIAPWKPFRWTTWAEGVREEDWYSEETSKHLQAAS